MEERRNRQPTHRNFYERMCDIIADSLSQALASADPDVFLSIYDKLSSQGYTKEQVDYIKERARQRFDEVSDRELFVCLPSTSSSTSVSEAYSNTSHSRTSGETKPTTTITNISNNSTEVVLQEQKKQSMSKNTFKYYQDGACLENSSAVEPCLAMVTSHANSGDDSRSNVTSSSEAGGYYVGAELEDDEDECGTNSCGDSMSGSQKFHRAVIPNQQYDESFSLETDDSSHSSESPDRERFAEAAGFKTSKKLNNDPNDEMFVVESSDGGGEESPRPTVNSRSKPNDNKDYSRPQTIAKQGWAQNLPSRSNVPDRWETFSSQGVSASVKVPVGKNSTAVETPPNFGFFQPYPPDACQPKQRPPNNNSNKRQDSLAGNTSGFGVPHHGIAPSAADREHCSSYTITPPPDSITDATNRHSHAVSATSKQGIPILNGNVYPRQPTMAKLAATDNSSSSNSGSTNKIGVSQRSSQSPYSSSAIESPPEFSGVYVPNAVANRHDNMTSNGFSSLGYEPRSGARSVTSYDDQSASSQPVDRDRSDSPSYGTQQKPQQDQKPRRRKKVAAVQDVKSDQVAGYQGHKTIDELIKFIDPKAAKKEKQIRKAKSSKSSNKKAPTAPVETEENDDTMSMSSTQTNTTLTSSNVEPVESEMVVASKSASAVEEKVTENIQEKKDTERQAPTPTSDSLTALSPMSEDLTLVIAVSNAAEDDASPSPVSVPITEDFTPVDNKKRNKKSTESKPQHPQPQRNVANSSAGYRRPPAAISSSSNTDASYLLLPTSSTSGKTGQPHHHHHQHQQQQQQPLRSSTSLSAEPPESKDHHTKGSISPAATTSANGNVSHNWWNMTRDSGVALTSPTTNSRESAISNSSASSTSSGSGSGGGRSSRPISDVACDSSPVSTVRLTSSSSSSTTTTAVTSITPSATASTAKTSAQLEKGGPSNNNNSATSTNITTNNKPLHCLSAAPFETSSKKTMPIQFGYPASIQPSSDAVVFMDGKDDKVDVVKRFGISFAGLESNSNNGSDSENQQRPKPISGSSSLPTPATSCLSFGTLDAGIISGVNQTSSSSSRSSFATANEDVPCDSAFGYSLSGSSYLPDSNAATAPDSVSRRSSSTSSSAAAKSSTIKDDLLLEFLARRWRTVESARMSSDERLRPVVLQC